MSMNILVETRTEPEVVFQKENPVLLQGIIAINEECNYVKIGDGVKPWSELIKLELPKDVIEKWLTIANSANNSHLVTLPDMNFAYSVINADSNAMIEETIDNIILGRNYFELVETKDEITSEHGTLSLKSKGVQDIIFKTQNEEERCKQISRISFSRNEKLAKKTREYILYDEESRKGVQSNRNNILKHTELISNIQNQIDNLKLFTLDQKGIVRGPNSEQHNERYVLTAKNSWREVRADWIPMSYTDRKTISQVIDDIKNDIQNAGTKLSIVQHDAANTEDEENTKAYYVLGVRGANVSSMHFWTGVKMKGGVLYGAAWNDYAEARTTKSIQPGRVVVENGDDTLSMSTERLMLGGNIVSDTYGMLIGETETAKTPIALCGRVLAYPNEDRSEYYAGAPVCTGPNGTVSIMTKDEVLHYPECIIGYVSAVPTYKEWNGIKVNNRIWIKVV